MKFILAVSDDNKIAIGNRLPWRISHDMKWFKMNTYNNTIIMGRKTFDALNRRELKNRRNIVISRNNIPGIETIKNINQVRGMDAIVIGGACICEQLWQKGDILILTRVHTTVPNGLEIRLPEYKELWSKDFGLYTFSINRITSIFSYVSTTEIAN